MTSTAFRHSGTFSHAISLSEQTMVKYKFTDPEGVNLFGYTHLEFWINGGEASGQDPNIAGKKLSELGIVPQADTWTLVSIPISELPLAGDRLTDILISGMVKETFYIDDMKLVAEQVEITAVEEVSETTAVPLGYALSQNFPNPFNQRTKITYVLPEKCQVKLGVWNLLGQKVVNLAKGTWEQRAHAVWWDGKNEAGKAVSSGIYFYRMSTGKFVSIRKMLLVK